MQTCPQIWARGRGYLQSFAAAIKAATAFSSDNAAADNAFNCGVISHWFAFILLSQIAKASETVFCDRASNSDEQITALFFIATPLVEAAAGWRIRKKQNHPSRVVRISPQGKNSHPVLPGGNTQRPANMHQAACLYWILAVRSSLGDTQNFYQSFFIHTLSVGQICKESARLY